MHRFILSASLIAGTMGGLGVQVGTAHASQSLSCAGARYCQPFIEVCREIPGELTQWLDANGQWIEYTCTVADSRAASRLAPLVSSMEPPSGGDGGGGPGGGGPVAVALAAAADPAEAAAVGGAGSEALLEVASLAKPSPHGHRF
jgi:hypothetical protein